MKRLTHPSPATIIALVALFFSLGGVGMAATGYRITSIFQIAPKVRHALQGQQGPVGAQGVDGAQGAPGATGPAGAGIDWGTEYYATSAQDREAGDATVTAVCNGSDIAVTGGFRGQNDTIFTSTAFSGGPSNFNPTYANGWSVRATISDGGYVEAWVLCLPAR